MKLLLWLVPVAAAACIAPMNMEAYQQAHQQRMYRMCTEPNFAYESGFNAGMERSALDTSWADQYCQLDYRDQARQSYQNGYHKGIENAPIVVRSNNRTYGRSYVPQSECRFSSDCGSGQSCRRDRSGANVCMGGGSYGDACWFSSDCLSDSCDGRTKTCR